MYGYCPKCYEAGEIRERRINGNDYCKNKHCYPSKDALNLSEEDLKLLQNINKQIDLYDNSQLGYFTKKLLYLIKMYIRGYDEPNI